MPNKTHQFPRKMNFPSIKYYSSIRWCPGNLCFLHQVLFPWHKPALFCTKFKLWKWILFTTKTITAIWHNLSSFHSILHKFVLHSFMLCTKKIPHKIWHNSAYCGTICHSKISSLGELFLWSYFYFLFQCWKVLNLLFFSAHRLTTWMDYKQSSSFEHLSPTVRFGPIWLNSTQFVTLCTIEHNMD